MLIVTKPQSRPRAETLNTSQSHASRDNYNCASLSVFASQKSTEEQLEGEVEDAKKALKKAEEAVKKHKKIREDAAKKAEIDKDDLEAQMAAAAAAAQKA